MCRCVSARRGMLAVVGGDRREVPPGVPSVRPRSASSRTNSGKTKGSPCSDERVETVLAAKRQLFAGRLVQRTCIVCVFMAAPAVGRGRPEGSVARNDGHPPGCQDVTSLLVENGISGSSWRMNPDRHEHVTGAPSGQLLDHRHHADLVVLVAWIQGDPPVAGPAPSCHGRGWPRASTMRKGLSQSE